ncbi:hypothetical protein MTR_7g076780 [Medicago truncatula]|uniref:Uncharacterized protein n=1 Tax=Medicago truncatula TaxID=3880 RepID=G7L3J6_MEDTR|nr:hypothetical protein MTR_7g076780 [Medicago truncatula]
MEENMKIHDKIHNFSTNLGKNPLLTLLLHVSLSRNFFSNMLCHQWKLLFDCINEVLMEVCEHYFKA